MGHLNFVYKSEERAKNIVGYFTVNWLPLEEVVCLCPCGESHVHFWSPCFQRSGTEIEKCWGRALSHSEVEEDLWIMRSNKE